MALVDDLTTQLTSFFDAIASQVSNGAANAAFPLIGKLTDVPGGATAADPFASTAVPLPRSRSSQ
jgi:hypothetical protein